MTGNPFDAPAGANPFDVAAAANPFDTPSLATSTAQPAVNMSPLTPIKGFITGLGRMATGLTSLGKAVVHDVMEVGAKIIPGEQSIEEEGFRLAAIGRAFIPSLASDYAKRYGGISNIARGLWEDPLSYINDALMVGGVAAVAAKAGRVGALLEHLPPLMSESTAAKVLGAGAEAGYKSVLEIGNTSLAPGVVETLKLSRNPVTRYLTEQGARAFSLPVGKVETGAWLAKQNPAEYTRAMGTINYAAANGIRIFKPGTSSFLAARRAGYTLTSSKVLNQDLGSAERAKIEAFYDQAVDVVEDGKAVPGTGAQLISAYQRGDHASTTPGVFDDVVVPGENSHGVLNATKTSDTPTGPDVMFNLEKEYGPGGFTHTNIDTPHDPHHAVTGDEITAGGLPQTYTVLVDSMDSVPMAVERTMKATGMQPIGLRNYMGDASVSYDGYHVFGLSEGGDIADFSFATPALHEAQLANSRILRHLDGLEAERGPLLEELAAEVEKAGYLEPSLAGPQIESSVLIADKLKMLEYKMMSAETAAYDMFRGHRLQHWAGKAPDKFDPNYVLAELSRPLNFNAISARWLDDADMGTYMEHAYLTQRVFKFHDMLAHTRESFKDILGGTKGPRGGKANVTAALAENLRASGLPDAKITEIMGSRNWWSGGSPAAVSKKVDRLAARMKNNLRSEMVVEGGAGLEHGFPAYDWRIMRQDRIAQGMPLPQYFPHYRSNRGAGGALVARPKGIVPRAAGITKHSEGILVEQGRIITDPVEALSRAAQEILSAQEDAVALGKLMDDVGRELTPLQAANWYDNPTSEVMVPLEHTQGLLSQRAEIFGDQLDGIARGKTLTEATLDAVDLLHERAFTEGMNAIGNTRVFAVSGAVMRQFKKEMATRWSGQMEIYYSGTMNMWKASVLSLSPRWVVNNTIGNQFFMGLENPGAIRYALEMKNKRTSDLYDQVFGAWSASNARGFHTDLQAMHAIPEDATGVLGMMKKIQEMRGPDKLSTASGKVRRWNQSVEQEARRGSFLSEVSKQLHPDWVQGMHSSEAILKRILAEGNVTTQVMENALKGVNKTLGDFTHFGVFEQAVVKKFMVPFWGFYRHAAKTLVRLPFDHPLKAAVLANIEMVDKMMEPEQPDWLRSRFKLMDFGGKDLMINTQNFNPLSQLSEPNMLFGVLNPIAKMTVERLLRVDTYTGEPFRTYKKGPGGIDPIIKSWDGSYYEMQFDSKGNFIGNKLLDGAPVPGLLAHAASNFPQLTFFPSFQRYPKSVALQIASLFGAPVSEIDVEKTVQSQADAAASAETTAQNRLAAVP